MAWMTSVLTSVSAGDVRHKDLCRVRHNLACYAVPAHQIGPNQSQLSRK